MHLAKADKAARGRAYLSVNVLATYFWLLHGLHGLGLAHQPRIESESECPQTSSSFFLRTHQILIMLNSSHSYYCSPLAKIKMFAKLCELEAKVDNCIVRAFTWWMHCRSRGS